MAQSQRTSECSSLRKYYLKIFRLYLLHIAEKSYEIIMTMKYR